MLDYNQEFNAASVYGPGPFSIRDHDLGEGGADDLQGLGSDLRRRFRR